MSAVLEGGFLSMVPPGKPGREALRDDSQRSRRKSEWGEGNGCVHYFDCGDASQIYTVDP